MTDCSIVITTTNKEETARIISSELVKSSLARCVQIDKVTSIYEWEGKIEAAEEHRLSIKTMDQNIGAVEKLILDLHNYELPEVIVLNIANGSEKYIEWLKTQ